ncbi:Hypothetical protein CINCED_3A016269 [Cinara cedri]|uniref:Uncharacterized protein n=1 Tax=Cinara cedri TaxID=506608 RepID=A0A5E4M9P7_9HEMI|nr:Hypothetical protein CINCED_3A016269 [Cinara cedri]
MPSCFICGRTRNVKSKSENITSHLPKAKIIFSELKEEVPNQLIYYCSSNLQIKRILLKLTDNSEPEKGILPLADLDLDQSIESVSSDTFNLLILIVAKKVNSSNYTASTASAEDTPRHYFLKYGICQLSNEIQIKNSKLRKLQQTIQHQNKKISLCQLSLKV